jgi:gluconolactonase
MHSNNSASRENRPEMKNDTGRAMKIFVDDMSFPEAPVLLPDGNYLFVEMGEERGCVTWISQDGESRRLIARTGRPNGLAIDSGLNIWVAETSQRAMLKLHLDGEYERFVEDCHGEKFLFLNDLVVAPNGDIYLTDSGIAMEEFAPGGELHPDCKNLRYDGRVYRIDPRTREIERIDNGYWFTNGIAFGPDENLYVAETFSGKIYRYPWKDGRITGPKELFGNVLNPEQPEGIKGPDGMKFGRDGKLYVAVFGQGDVTVLNSDGTVDRRMPVGGAWPTNLAFGPEGEQRIYITEAETGTVRICDVGTDGYPLNY